MVQQTNLDLQHQFGECSLTAAYVGVISNGLGRGLNLDQPDPPGADYYATYGQAKYKYLTELPYVESLGEKYNGSIGNYDALNVIFSRQFKSGLRLNGNYTWSHALDDTWPGSSVLWASNPKYGYDNSSTASGIVLSPRQVIRCLSPTI
jgi:hypothetical protein